VNAERPSSPFWRRGSWGLLLCLLLTIAATFRDYGITWDEESQSLYGRALVRWFASFFSDDSFLRVGNLFYYGGLFDIIAEIAASLTPQSRYETRHLLGALLGFATVVAVHRIGTLLLGPVAGFFSALFLVLTPVFFGHMFNNPKDIPFAALCTVATLAMLIAWSDLPRLRFSRALCVGAAIGGALGVRAGGLILFVHLTTLFAAWMFVNRSLGPPVDRAAIRSLARSFLTIAAVAWLVMLACWPWALASPLARPFEAMAALAHLDESRSMLFDGRVVYAGDLPRTYVPLWLAVSLPEFYLVAFLAGVAAFGRTWRRRELGRPALTRRLQVAWVASIAGLPLLVAVAARPHLYDGLRHLLFTLPPLAVLAGVSVAAFFGSAPARPYRVAVGAVLLALGAWTVADMARLHPYEAVYFNRLVAGGVAAGSERFETDYWGSSYKEGLEWLVDNYGHGIARRVRVATTFVTLPCTYYMGRSSEGSRRFLCVVLDNDPHVVLSITRKRMHEQFKGRVLHVVERQGASLLYVIETRRPLPGFVHPPRPGDPRIVPVPATSSAPPPP
jgi:hypothetical protein